MSTSPSLNSIGLAPRAKPELRGEVSPNRQPAWLTDVVVAVVHAVRGQVKAIAISLDIAERRVYRASDVRDPEPLKAWWIPTICRETGSFAILDAIEAQVGRVAVSLPIADPHHPEFYEQAGRLAQRVGDVLQTLPEILRDGRIDACENALFATMGRQLIADMVELIEIVEAKHRRDEAA